MKKIIKTFFCLLGYEIHKTSIYRDETYHLMTCIKELGINFIIDTGANRGQFAQSLFKGNYKGEILSIEPLSVAWEELNNKAQSHGKWNVFPKSALGGKTGEAIINVSKNLDSSSILPMTELHLRAAPWSNYVGQEKCTVYALDDIFTKININEKHKILLKIDCQGFEYQILQGAVVSLAKVEAVLTEVSLKELYSGQKLWMEIINMLSLQGFSIYSVIKGFTDPKTGETLQLDIVFKRKSQK
jgi:FkbM family methyltransferase